MKHLLPGLFIVVSILGCGERPGEIVAEVNGKQISSHQFHDRYGKYLAQFQQRDNLLLRKQILNNMINELLIHEDIQRLGLDADRSASEKLRSIRTQAILDEYAKSVSLDTLHVSEGELEMEFVSFNTKVNARYLLATNVDDAVGLKRRLREGETFETLAREVFQDPGLANNGGSLGTFGWGELESPLEEAAFSIPIGEVSDPIKIRAGYAVLRVDHRMRMPLSSRYDFEKKREKLERAIIERKVVRFVKQAGENIANEMTYRFNEDVVNSIFVRWASITSDDGSGDEIVKTKSSPVLDPKTELVRVNNEVWAVTDFLDRLDEITPSQKRRVKSSQDIKSLVQGLVARDAIVRRAETLGIAASERVHEQVTRISEEYLLKRWAARVQDTVGQNGFAGQILKDLYQSKRHEYAYPPEVNVAEVLVRTRTEAESILKELRQGKSFARLAAEKSIRLWAAKNGGELGYGTRATYGILGEKFFAATKGMIIGPEFVDPYFGIFKILGKREGRQKTFEEATPSIVEELKAVKKREAFSAAVENLRARSNISIRMEALANVDLRKPT